MRLYMLTLFAVVVSAVVITNARGGGAGRLTVPQIIRVVFGSYGDQAVKVASCETGGTFSIWATNGIYWGVFQMGAAERARYGHGWTAWAQARAAYRYFVDSGRDWSPWSCGWAAYR